MLADTEKCVQIKLFCRYIANRVFIALANGTVAVLQRPSSKQQFLLKLIFVIRFKLIGERCF